ncbi:MAG TPA: hypothetical protein DD405_04135 [Desulfobacteraceae bacterium]|nr:hypothetical protein [Desulfobacteraceae bacterium]
MKKKVLPPSFSLIKKGNRLIYMRNIYKEQLLGMGIENQAIFLKNNKSTIFYNGRDPVPSVLINKTDNERMVIKHYTHGGFTRIFNKDIFWGKPRPLKELFFVEKIISLNIPTYEILALIIDKMPFFFYRADLITKELSNGVDLKTYFENLSTKQDKTRIKEKREVIKSVAGVIRKMHSAGIYHADLHLKNIIIKKNINSPPLPYIIDFDNSSIKRKLSFKKKLKNLFRFHRYIDKIDKKSISLSRSDFLRFFKEYFNNVKNTDQYLREYLHGYSKHVKFHKLWKPGQKYPR